MSYAEVAVNSPGAGRRTFSYAVPSNLSLEVGHAVWAPFGPRLAQGVVLELTQHPAVEDTRDIVGLIDPRPVISPPQAELARWMSDYYLSPLFDAVALMLPPAFERRVLTHLTFLAEPDDPTSLTLKQGAVLKIARERGRVELKEVERAVGRSGLRASIDSLVRRGLLAKSHELERVKVRPKTVAQLRLNVEPQAVAEQLSILGKRAPKQARLLESLASIQGGSIPLSEAREQAGVSAVDGLRNKGLAVVERVQVYRDPLAHRSFQLDIPPTLTPAQDAACGEVKVSLAAGDCGVFLLHGVTGSGKTEVYLRALEEAISLGRRAIVLVPEIALTPQTIARFSSRFPGRVAVLHSKLSVGEQFDEWWRIKEGEFDVVIGSRGAVFAPQPDLGLIVIDEEHEWTYKQQEHPPRYHARDVAIRLAEMVGATVVLGSATPDVASFYKSQLGDYRLLELPERIAKSERKVSVVDLRRELKAGNRGIFSRSLYNGIKQTLDAREQAILFLNRRGSATFVQCRDCGHVLRCRRCDVSLTYHSVQEDLVCHQCNYHTPMPGACPQCGSGRIKFLGVGTQRVEEELRQAFPQARTLRWDRDVTGGKRSHEDILDSFVAHEADVLIGTQMIAKGLDLPLVTLVGVINADVSLYLPDFRAGERTFQILSQVAGRAGRGTLAGQVIVQSYTPQHYAIVCAAGHDYPTFYQREIASRRRYRNPPFSRLTRLLYTNTNSDACRREAQRVHRLLREERDSWGLDFTIIGPSPAFIPRVRGRYRWQIVLRGDDPVELLQKLPLSRGWTVDIDPMSLL